MYKTLLGASGFRKVLIILDFKLNYHFGLYFFSLSAIILFTVLLFSVNACLGDGSIFPKA